MDAPAFRIVEAAPEHFAAIVRIERAAGGSSLVALTAELALEEALQRGHYVSVALDGDTVAGWIWFSVDGSRGGEEVGHLFRVAVAPERARSGWAGARRVRAGDARRARVHTHAGHTDGRR